MTRMKSLGLGVALLVAATLSIPQTASARWGGGWHGGGWHGGGWRGGWGWGGGALGLGLGLAAGAALAGPYYGYDYGYGYPAGYYGYYGYGGGCYVVRRWGPYGPHRVTICD